MITMKLLQECHALAVKLLMMKTALARLKESGVALGNGLGVSATHIAHIPMPHLDLRSGNGYILTFQRLRQSVAKKP